MSDPPAPLDPYLRDLVRCKARQLVGKAGIRPQDRPDIEQDLLVDVLPRFCAFDSNKMGWDAFARMVVHRAVSRLIRHRRAARRDDHLVLPLGDAGVTQDARRQTSGGNPENLADLTLDVADILAGLPPEHRALIERVISGSLAEAARELGIARTTLSDRVQAILAEEVWDRLDAYSSPRPVFRRPAES